MPTLQETQKLLSDAKEDNKELKKTAMETEAELKKQIEDLKKTILALQEQGGAAAGYVIRTQSVQYTGTTGGVFFRQGVGFIPDGPDAEQRANLLKADFGYSVEHVDNYFAINSPVNKPKTMLETLS